VAVIARYGRHPIGELVPAMPRGGRERSSPVFAVFQPVCTVYLAAQRSHAIMVAGVKNPHAPRGVPNPAETAGSEREVGVIRTANRDAAVLLFNDRQWHSTFDVQHSEIGVPMEPVAARQAATRRRRSYELELTIIRLLWRVSKDANPPTK